MSAAPRPNRVEREATGKARRGDAPRSAPADWRPAPHRDPLAPLDAACAGRLPDLLALRAQRMSASPFAFYRGGADLMAYDLSTLPVSGIDVQCCGDAHILNFGGFATPERRVIFDINDFDETLRGPWEWDVLRLVTSVVLGARERTFAKKFIRSAVLATVQCYRLHMQEYAQHGPLDLWYERIDEARLLAAAPMPADRQPGGAIAKLTTGSGWERRFIDDPPTIFHPKTSDDVDLPAIFAAYPQTLTPAIKELFGRYTLVDSALKVVGVGSVGTRCGIGLFTDGDDHWLLLQIKESQHSALEPYLAPSVYENQGQRCVQGQRLMQYASDIFLGWSSWDGHDYYIRQFRDMKTGVDLAALSEQPYLAYVEYCARALAMGHARSGDAAAIAGYLGKKDAFDKSALAFAERYADLTESDHARFAEREKPAPATLSS
jgi:uncharacterized protein (DUF2252 family)